MKKYFLIPIVAAALATTVVYADKPNIGNWSERMRTIHWKDYVRKDDNAIEQVYAENKDLSAFGKTYGKTYGEWSAEWTKWEYSGTKDNNAIDDMTGDSCDLNQPKGPVWFLAGSFGKPGVVRSCTIPPNKALFYPIIEANGWIDCPPPSTDSSVSEAVIRSMAKEDGAVLITSTLDGVTLTSLQIPTVHAQAPVFTTILPVNNIAGNPSCSFMADGTLDPNWSYPPGKTGRMFVDGTWIMLPPLTPGDHILTLHGAVAKCTLDAGINKGICTGWAFENEVTYHLTVLAKGHDQYR